MICRIEPLTFLEKSTQLPVVDVRSPGEYLTGHIPGALSIPLFTDLERAEIGTLYNNAGRHAAILRGLDIALPAVFDYTTALQSVIHSNEIMVYCWRGGLRSRLMAECFRVAGYRVHVLEGGYKAFRRMIRRKLAEGPPVRILGGYTGSGKTAILHSLKRLGEQVIDLEFLACHRGSVFGSFGMPPQPTNEQFENALGMIWNSIDTSRPVWIEDESRKIGSVTLPDPFYAHIANGLLVMITLPHETRISRLVEEYGNFSADELGLAITRIGERLGGTRTKMAHYALQKGDLHQVAGIALEYYDKAYRHSLDLLGRKQVSVILSGTQCDEQAARILFELTLLTDEKRNIP